MMNSEAPGQPLSICTLDVLKFKKKLFSHDENIFYLFLDELFTSKYLYYGKLFEIFENNESNAMGSWRQNVGNDLIYYIVLILFDFKYESSIQEEIAKVINSYFKSNIYKFHSGVYMILLSLILLY